MKNNYEKGNNHAFKKVVFWIGGSIVRQPLKGLFFVCGPRGKRYRFLRLFIIGDRISLAILCAARGRLDSAMERLIRDLSIELSDRSRGAFLANGWHFRIPVRFWTTQHGSGQETDRIPGGMWGNGEICCENIGDHSFCRTALFTFHKPFLIAIRNNRSVPKSPTVPTDPQRWQCGSGLVTQHGCEQLQV